MSSAATSALTQWQRLRDRIDGSPRALWLAVFLPLLLLYVWTLRTNITDLSADPVGVGPSAWALAHHGTPVIRQEYWPYGNPWFVPLGHGQVVSNRMPGLIYLAAPMYLLMHGADPRDIFPTSVVAPFVAAAAMATLAVLLARLTRPRVALAAALIAGTGTTTWAISGTALWPHGPDQLFLVLGMLALSAGYYTRTGIACALAITFRPLLALVPAVLGLRDAWRRRSLRPALLVGVPAALGLACYALYVAHYWHAPGGAPNSQVVNTATHSYGTSLRDFGWSVWPGYAEKIAGTLVSPGRGVLTGSPFLLALLPGLRPAWRSAPAWVRSCALSALIYMLVQLKGEVFSGGQYFWGYRYPLEPFTLCAPLLLLAWQQWTSSTAVRRAAFQALVIVSVALQAVGAACFRGPYPDRPWTFDYLANALTGQRAVLAWPLFLAGLFGAAWCYLRGRGSGRPDVLHVAGADHLLTA